VIHPTAVIDPRAEIASSARVGPYAVIGPRVIIGDDVELRAHVVLEGPTTIAARTIIHPFTAIGGEPQDRSHRGEATAVEIGEDVIVREHVTVHRGTVRGASVTRIGARSYLMAGCHIAHDAQVGEDVTLAGGTMLAGHVVLEHGVVTGGGAAFAQFTRVGALAFVAAGARVEHAVPPYVIAQGDRARVRALNEVGLERRGVPEASRESLRSAYRALYRSGRPIAVSLHEIAIADPFVDRLVCFLRTHTCIGGPSRR
jgi:UDP-N-acetylglucosamine acyltransferase